MQTILLATDGSPAARAATGQAIELAQATGWPLRVVVAWRTPVVTGYGYGPTMVYPELEAAERAEATEVAGAAARRAHEAGVTATTQVREGDAADEICAAAAEVGAGLIVVGSHGWGPIRRMLFGSVSTRVLHEAPCGVLVVHAPADADATE